MLKNNNNTISYAELLKAEAYLVRGGMNQKRVVTLPEEYITEEKPLSGL